MIITVEITIGEKDVTLEVDYAIWGNYEKETANQPAFYPEVEYTATLDGVPFEPTPKQNKQIVDECWQDAKETREASLIDQYD